MLDEDEHYVDEDKIDYWNYDTERLLAKYFEIDLQKVDDERRVMIEGMRKEHNAKEATTAD